MKIASVSTVLLFWLAHGVATAQGPNTASDAPTYDKGTIANGVYTNDCLGISFVIPSGWELKRFGNNSEGKALHLPNGQLGLITVQRPSVGTLGSTIGLTAVAANDAVSTRDLVTRAVQGLIGRDPEHRQLLQPALAVEYGGKQFYRSDFKQSPSNGEAVYLSFVYTTFRGYDIGASVSATSWEALDASVDTLKGIKFQQGQADSKCTVGDPDPKAPVFGTITSTPPKPQPNTVMRVSQKVSQALLVQKVEPQYPANALQAHVTGDVVLKARINKSGDVEDVSVISGDPMLAPAAIEAVKQWKYKPYLLQGEAVNVETQVTVTFGTGSN